MLIHLTEDREQFVRSLIREGRYASEDEVIAEALHLLREKAERAARLESLRKVSQAVPVDGGSAGMSPPVDPGLGSIGFLRNDCELLDEIVADAYRQRREETWRDLDLE